MLGVLAIVAVTVLIAGCAGPRQLLSLGGSLMRSACAGLPTDHQPDRYFAIIVGVPLTRRFACESFGKPVSVRRIADGRERWSYEKAGAPAGPLVITVK